MWIGIWIQAFYSRNCHINTAGEVFRRGQRKLGREFQGNPVGIRNLMKQTRPSKLFPYCTWDVPVHSHPSFTDPKCPLPTASSKGCSSSLNSSLGQEFCLAWRRGEQQRLPFLGGTHRDPCRTSAPPWAPSPCPWSSGRPCRWSWNQASPHWTPPTASGCSGAPAKHTARALHWYKPCQRNPTGCCTQHGLQTAQHTILKFRTGTWCSP